jgi:hypothetical protein
MTTCPATTTGIRDAAGIMTARHFRHLHGQASAFTTAVLPQPGCRPFVPGDAERPEAALSSIPGNSELSCPSPTADHILNCGT